MTYNEENGFYRETIAYVPTKVFIRGRDDYEQKMGRYTISALNIAVIQRWLAKVGISSTLLIYREGERNRVFLRLLLDGPKDVEAIWLAKLRRERLAPHVVRERISQKVALCA